MGQSQRHKHAHARARPRLLRRRLKRRRLHSQVCSPGPHPVQTSPGQSTKRTGKAVEETHSVHQTCACMLAHLMRSKKCVRTMGGKAMRSSALKGFRRGSTVRTLGWTFSMCSAVIGPDSLTSHTLLALRSPPLRSCRASRFSSLQNSRPWISAVQW